jgi:hypothetical protein
MLLLDELHALAVERKMSNSFGCALSWAWQDFRESGFAKPELNGHGPVGRFPLDVLFLISRGYPKSGKDKLH